MPEIGQLRINLVAHIVAKASKPVRLTRREFDFVWHRASQARGLVTQAWIFPTLLGPVHAEGGPSLLVYVRQFRAKIGDDASDPRYIFTEPRVGYRFRSERSDQI